MRVEVKVTQEHIDNGLRQVCGECPVALAMEEATGQPWSVSPGTMWRADTEYNPWTVEVATPEIAAIAIQKYDDTGYMEPFTFPIDLPDRADIQQQKGGE